MGHSARLIKYIPTAALQQPLSGRYGLLTHKIERTHCLKSQPSSSPRMEPLSGSLSPSWFPARSPHLAFASASHRHRRLRPRYRHTNKDTPNSSFFHDSHLEPCIRRRPPEFLPNASVTFDRFCRPNCLGQAGKPRHGTALARYTYMDGHRNGRATKRNDWYMNLTKESQSLHFSHSLSSPSSIGLANGFPSMFAPVCPLPRATGQRACGRIELGRTTRRFRPGHAVAPPMARRGITTSSPQAATNNTRNNIF